jgi:hypothetical protein
LLVGGEAVGVRFFQAGPYVGNVLRVLGVSERADMVVRICRRKLQIA